MAYRLSYSVACGIFLDQGLNPGLLHWWEVLYKCATREAPLPLYVIKTGVHAPKDICVRMVIVHCV